MDCGGDFPPPARNVPEEGDCNDPLPSASNGSLEPCGMRRSISSAGEVPPVARTDAFARELETQESPTAEMAGDICACTARASFQPEASEARIRGRTSRH